MKLGPTGRFPRGKLDEGDEGELLCAISVNRGTVILAFGTSVEWLGLTPQGARMLAEALMTYADVAAKAH